MILEAPKGSNIYSAIRDVKAKLSRLQLSEATLIFNDIHITVSADSNDSDLAIIYSLRQELRRLQKV